MSDAAAEGQPADAGGADDAAGGGEPERLGGGVEVQPGRAASGDGHARRGVDVHRAQRGEVDDEPAVADAVAGGVVPAPAHGHLQPVVAREVERGDDVPRAGATDDDRRPPVDQRVEAATRGVVRVVARDDDRARERQAQLVEAKLRLGRGHRTTR